MFRKPFHLFVISAVLLLIVAPLLQQGLFIDGLLYKTVSVNYARGECEFWRMKFSNTSMNPFFEQPPFFFFLNGIYFRVAGNSFLADKLFTLLLLVFSFVLLRRITKILMGQDRAGILPILFLVSIPVVCWSFQNQVIETLALPLCLFTFYVFLKLREMNNILDWIFCLLVFVSLLLLLFFTKGFQSCFIILAPFIFSIFFKEKRSFWFGFFSSVFFLVLLYFVLYVHKSSAAWFSEYLHKRLLASLEGVGATAPYRAEIAVRIVTELIPVFILVFVSWIFFRKENADHNQNRKMAHALLFIALCGSLPFMITLEQRGFYLLPSLPFYIFSILLYFQNFLMVALGRVMLFFEKKWLSLITLLLFLGSLVSCMYAPFTFKRDENRLHDLALIIPELSKGDTIWVSEDSWNDVALQAYLYMQKQVSVLGLGVFHNTAEKQNFESFLATQTGNGGKASDHRFYIYDREHSSLALEGFEKVDIPVKQYELFRKKQVKRN